MNSHTVDIQVVPKLPSKEEAKEGVYYGVLNRKNIMLYMLVDKEFLKPRFVQAGYIKTYNCINQENKAYHLLHD